MVTERVGPNPWLVWVGSLATAAAVSLVSGGIAWGKAEAQHVALERRVGTNEASIGAIQREQTAQGRELAGLAPELRAINERLSDIRETLRKSR